MDFEKILKKKQKSKKNIIYLDILLFHENWFCV